MSSSKKELKEVQKIIKVRFRDKKTLEKALTHYSCFGRSKSNCNSHYERLEFLGDSILGSYISQFIFSLNPDATEEELTNLRSELTSNSFLAEVALGLGLDKYIRFSDEPFDYNFTERSRYHIYADSVEAIIGAICVDRGEKASRRFIKKHILPRLGEASKRAEQDNPKSALQKLLHQQFSENPTYEKLSESGCGEDYCCEVGVYVDGKLLAKAEGVNKKDASEKAAEMALLAQLDN